VDPNSILKLRPSVAVSVREDFVEFFMSNIRKSVTLKLQSSAVDILFELNGTRSLASIFNKNKLSEDEIESFLQLLMFLNSNSIVIEIDQPYGKEYEMYPRVFNLLEDYLSQQSQVITTFNKIKRAKVMIIGLGSVGTWVAKSLLMSGVANFILVDPDKITISNLHRQIGFQEVNVDERKVQVMQKRLTEMNPDVDITIYEDWLDKDFFEKNNISSDIDLIVNCADHPTVDETSKLIGEFAMVHKIRHIIGGGYNLHQSLIGQVVFPGETACIECFRLNLEDINVIDTSNITKLQNGVRKVGSFPPLSSLSASITANEAFKVIAELPNIVMKNNRTEFLMRELNFSNLLMGRRPDCNWCGYEGKYYQLSRD
jgi:molybdopterin-synthase adenylyltransferase